MTYEGGHWRPSKRWRELILWGPYSLDQVCIGTMRRQPERDHVAGRHRFVRASKPAGCMVDIASWRTLLGEFMYASPHLSS